MSARCSPKQVAEAVLIWSSHNGKNPVLCKEFEDIEHLKCLDLFLSTLVVFSDAFSDQMNVSYGELIAQPSPSKKDFIEFLSPRSLLLAGRNGYFDFILICTYFSVILNFRAHINDCFHLAGVASKLLTRVLEKRFREVFVTAYGWEHLMWYCTNIHSALFPSKKNRPLGFQLDGILGPDKEKILKGIVNNKSAEFVKQLDEDYVQRKLQRRITRDERLTAEQLGLIPVNEESSDSSSSELHSSDIERIPDLKTYWNYCNLDLHTIRKKITQGEAHLKDVYYLLETLEQNMNIKCMSATEYDIYISDNEYIEQLEKKDNEKIVFSKSMTKFYANKICADENKRLGATSSQDQVNPENITHDQILEFISNEFDRDDSKCELCDGKMRAFIEYWSESFRGKYSNSTIVTDVI